MVLAAEDTLIGLERRLRHASAAPIGRAWRLKRVAMAAVVSVLALAAAGCREERKVDVAAGLKAGMPTMKTKNVSTLISDSGVTQYRIVSPLWTVYDEVDTPYWTFPEGLYLQKYDPSFKVVSTVAADSARYLKNQHLWRLDGNVEITRVPGTLFQTQQLYWNERTHKLFTDSFIHIQTPTHVLEGYGLESDDRLNDYRILRPQGIFPVDKEKI